MLKRIMNAPNIVTGSLLLIAGLVGVIAFAAWAEPFAGRLWPMSPYAAAPLFDMLAFSLVCVYAIALVAAHHLARGTAWVAGLIAGLALTAIVLHPGLMFWQLWRDGFGLPPASYFHFYTQDQLVGLTFGVSGYLLTAIVLGANVVRPRPASRFSAGILAIGGAGMFWYSLLTNVFIQESWFVRVWIALGFVFACTVSWLLVRSRR